MDKNFSIEESEILEGVLIIKYNTHTDSRGEIWTTFHNEIERKLLPDNLNFKHDKFSKSKKNVLRGFHGDTKSWKLVTCVSGQIQQVVIDCRKNSQTYLRYHSFLITDESKISVLIPPKMGNAFAVLSESAVYHYKLAYDGDYLDADEQFSVKWDDNKYNIPWLVKTPILSKRDL